MSRWIPLSLGLGCGALVTLAAVTAEARSTLRPDRPIRFEVTTPEPEAGAGDVDCLVLGHTSEQFLEVWFRHQLGAGRDQFVQGGGATLKRQGATVSPADWVCAYAPGAGRSHDS